MRHKIVEKDVASNGMRRGEVNSQPSKTTLVYFCLMRDSDPKVLYL